MRIGHGYDVHKLVEGRPLKIEGGSYRLCEGGGEHCGRPCRRRYCVRKENEQ